MENKADDEDGIDISAAEKAITADKYDSEKIIVYDRSKKGFYVRQRHYDSRDIRLLAECVYSAKFLAQGQADRLADMVCEFVSKYQAEKIRHDAFLTDRVKTSNQAVLKHQHHQRRHEPPLGRRTARTRKDQLHPMEDQYGNSGLLKKMLSKLYYLLYREERNNRQLSKNYYNSNALRNDPWA